MQQTPPAINVRLEDIDWREMVELDRHRPGTGRGRLIKEQIPVWALIGYAGALTGTTDPEVISTDKVMAAVARDYEVPITAVMAAVQYYISHRGPIDAVLEVNASVTG
ncbi:MAG: hypothetical protein QM692_03955 [Thermomicrobiales bacterium]